MQTMRDQTDESMVEVFKDVYKSLRARNLAPNPHVMDNACSKVIKAFIQKEKVKIHLVKPHNHRVNGAEAVVKASKYHAVSALVTVNATCLLRL